MKHILRMLAGLAVAVALFAVPALAQEKVAAGPSGGGGGEKVAAPSAPSGGGSSGSSGGSSGSGMSGGSFGGGFSGGRDSDSGRRAGSTGGSGYSAPRSPRAVDNGAKGPGMSGAPRGESVPSGERGRRAGDGSGRTSNTPGADGVPTYSRPRDGNEPVGTAVPRGTTPTRPNGGIFIPGGYYGGYYGGYGYYDPWGYNGGYGYYGGYYDPWYGGYPTYQDPQGGSYYASGDEGSLRLKIKPREGEVYVDGYYVGLVDDFDGIFQRLHLDSGAHRIEVRAPGYEPLAFDVHITADHTTTYQGELKKIQ
jgi:PEGA domain-containing protein